MDEVQCAFTKSFSDPTIITELNLIGDSTEGVFHAILSGSSSVLRLLCTGKLPLERQAEYPNYKGLDLNSTKYIPVWLYPFQADGFKAHLSETYVDDQGTVIRAYLHSGGYPGLIQQSIENEKPEYSYTLSDKGNFNGPHEKVLHGVFEKVSVFVEAHEDPWDKISSTVQKIPIGSLGRDLQPSTLYDLADNGILSYDDVNREVSFSSPALYYNFIAFKDTAHVTPMELAYLQIKSTHAEPVALRLMAQSYSQWLPEVPNLLPLVGELRLPIEHDHPVPIQTTRAPQLCKEGIVWK